MAPKGRTDSGSAGFSLVEVLVMSLLLAFVLLSVATLFVFGVKHNAWGRDETILANLAQRKMEQLRKIPPSDLNLDPWAAGKPALPTFGPTNSWHCLVDPGGILDMAGPPPWSSKRELWPTVGLSPYWTASDFAGDDLNELQFRWNYCSYDVTFGECRKDGTPCGPDKVGPYIAAKKVLVEVCRKRKTDIARRRGHREHCAKLEMYR